MVYVAVSGPGFMAPMTPAKFTILPVVGKPFVQQEREPDQRQFMA